MEQGRSNFTAYLERDEKGSLTKRKMLSVINRIFDLLGIAAPVVISGKMLYSEVCLKKLKWDVEVPDDIQRQWNKWLKGMEECPPVSIPGSVVSRGLAKLVLHGFADSSKLAVSVAIYVSITHHLTSSSESACREVKDSVKKPVNPSLGTCYSTYTE